MRAVQSRAPHNAAFFRGPRTGRLLRNPRNVGGAVKLHGSPRAPLAETSLDRASWLAFHVSGALELPSLLKIWCPTCRASGLLLRRPEQAAMAPRSPLGAATTACRELGPYEPLRDIYYARVHKLIVLGAFDKRYF